MNSKFDFTTDYRKDKKRRDRAIYEEFQELSAQPGASLGEVTKYLMEKYGIHSISTIWTIRRKGAEEDKREGRAKP